MRCLLALALALAAQVCAVQAAPASREVAFLLHDKTTVRGTIVSFKDEVYEVATKSLGTVKVPVPAILRIDYDPDALAVAASAAAPSASPATPATPAQPAPQALGDRDRISALFGFEAILKMLMGDPQALAKVEQLASDPAFVAVIDDPEISKAIEDGNFVKLATNKKVLALMNHPIVKELTENVTRKPPATDEE